MMVCPQILLFTCAILKARQLIVNQRLLETFVAEFSHSHVVVFVEFFPTGNGDHAVQIFNSLEVISLHNLPGDNPFQEPTFKPVHVQILS